MIVVSLSSASCFSLYVQCMWVHKCQKLHNIFTPYPYTIPYTRWRLVIHGGIDGYSRLVVYLHCSTDNRSSTVLDSFVQATSEFGIPSHVRSDKGSENRLVALYMLSQLGTNRNSMLTGRSCHNQRIERYVLIQ